MNHPALPPSGACGQALPHESARAHVTGAAPFIDDLPELAGTLHAAPILSPLAHGRLLGLDTAAALGTPGEQEIVLEDLKRDMVAAILRRVDTVLRQPTPYPQRVPGLPDDVRLLSARERLRLSLFDRRQSPWRLLASIDGVSQARFDRSAQRVLFTRLSAGGLWSVDAQLSTGSIQQVSEDRPSRWRYRTWTVARDGSVDYLSNGASCATLFSRINAGATRTEHCLDADRLSAGNGFSAQPDGSALYVALAVADGADIGVMPLPEAPVAVFSAVSNALFLKGK